MGGVVTEASRSPSRRRPPGTMIVAAVVAGLVLVAGVGYAVIRVRQHHEAAAVLRSSGIQASVSTSLADLMQLSPVPVTRAPGFTLTDQAGHPMSLAGLRGRVVVLEFMDRTAPTSAPSSLRSSSAPTVTWALERRGWCSSR